MAYKDLRQFISRLEEDGLLVRISEEVDWNLEVGAIMEKTFAARGPAVLFENVKDSPHPLLSGAMYTTRRMGLALGTEGNMRALMRKGLQAMRNPISPVLIDSGPCQENVITGEMIDLFTLPTPKWHEKDGGRYIGTMGLAFTRDPDTGIRNLGIYRQQILGKNETGVLATQHLGTMLQKYQAMCKPMPIATAIGVAPEVLTAAVFRPVYGRDEMGIAGGLGGEPVPMVKCKTIDVEVPATAEVVLEGVMEIEPSKWKDEGPFGEFPGHYSGRMMPRPVIRLTAITHRDNPILQGSMEGAPPNEGHSLRSVAYGVSAWSRLLDMGIPGVKEVHLSEMGCTQYWAIVSVDRQYYGGNARQIIEGLWATGTHAKWAIVVDDDIDIFDPGQVEYALSSRVQPHRDIVITSAAEAAPELDPSIDPAARSYRNSRGSRIGIDATMQYKGFDFAPKSQPSRDLMEKVEEKWSGKGLF